MDFHGACPFSKHELQKVPGAIYDDPGVVASPLLRGRGY